MNERQTELINYALKIIEKRATDPDRTTAQRIAYDSALCMLLYAINEDEECLAQFDY